MLAFRGLQESHEPPPLGDERGIIPVHRHGHQNGHQSGHILHCCFVLAIWSELSSDGRVQWLPV